MLATLRALNGTLDIEVCGLLLVAGRHSSCDARLDSLRVSRRHCCLALADNEVLVRDLGSHNGTRINGQKIETGILRHGDILEIAHLRFQLNLSPAGEHQGTHPSRLTETPAPPPGTPPDALATDDAEDR